MNRIVFRSFSISAIAAASALFAAVVVGQNSDNIKRNNPFAPSPKAKVKVVDPQPQNVRIIPVAANIVSENRETPAPPRSIGPDTHNIAKHAANVNVQPTGTYRIGVGDVLVINVENAATSSGSYVVRGDGTIDFPLAGEDVIVNGKTTDEIAESLTNAVKIYKTPQITVKIREYASHGVMVGGLVEVPGLHQIQRDAVPLYVIRAAAITSPRASGVTIKRQKDSGVESFLLANDDVDAVLIYPGDSVEFTGKPDSIATGYYFIGGDIATGGKKELSAGLTLSKALAAAGGVTGNAKRALIRRRNDSGMLITSEYELKGIISRRIPDPGLNQGDMVEIGK